MVRDGKDLEWPVRKGAGRPKSRTKITTTASEWEWHVQELLSVQKMGFEGSPRQEDRNDELWREQHRPRAAEAREENTQGLLGLKLQTLTAPAGEGISTQEDTAGETLGMTWSQPGEAKEMFYKLNQRSKRFSLPDCFPVEAQLLPKYFSTINEMQITVYYL